MIHEHALTYKDKLTIEQIRYLTQKANRLGEVERHLHGVYEQSDEEGTHVYFSVDAPKEKNNENN